MNAPIHSLPDRPRVLQVLTDIVAILFGAFFIVATACSIPLAMFMLLFCSEF